MWACEYVAGETRAGQQVLVVVAGRYCEETKGDLKRLSEVSA